MLFRFREYKWRLLVGNWGNAILTLGGAVILLILCVLIWEPWSTANPTDTAKASIASNSAAIPSVSTTTNAATIPKVSVTATVAPMAEASGIGTDSAIKIVAGLLGLLALLGGAIRTLANGLLGGGSKAAQGFVEMNEDPMDKLRTHYGDMIDASGYKIMIFIDDIDRCMPAKVVNLLEGIQTLFSHRKVAWIVGGDRRWVASAFETHFAAMSGDPTKGNEVAEAGNRFGYQFVEKLFQITVTLPSLTGDLKAKFWSRVLDNDSAEPVVDIGWAFSIASTEQEILRELARVTKENYGDASEFRKQAVLTLSSKKTSTSVEHFLTKFGPLVKANPRAMKRLVNSYMIYRDVALLSGLTIEPDDGSRENFARWVILAIDTPLLLDALEADPAILDRLRSRPTDSGSDEIQPTPSTLPFGLNRLWIKPRVQGLIYGCDIDHFTLPPLTAGDISYFAPLRG